MQAIAPARYSEYEQMQAVFDATWRNVSNTEWPQKYNASDSESSVESYEGAERPDSSAIAKGYQDSPLVLIGKERTAHWVKTSNFYTWRIRDMRRHLETPSDSLKGLARIVENRSLTFGQRCRCPYLVTEEGPFAKRQKLDASKDNRDEDKDIDHTKPQEWPSLKIVLNADQITVTLRLDWRELFGKHCVKTRTFAERNMPLGCSAAEEAAEAALQLLKNPLFSFKVLQIECVRAMPEMKDLFFQKVGYVLSTYRHLVAVETFDFTIDYLNDETDVHRFLTHLQPGFLKDIKLTGKGKCTSFKKSWSTVQWKHATGLISKNLPVLCYSVMTDFKKARFSLPSFDITDVKNIIKLFRFGHLEEWLVDNTVECWSFVRDYLSDLKIDGHGSRVTLHDSQIDGYIKLGLGADHFLITKVCKGDNPKNAHNLLQNS